MKGKLRGLGGGKVGQVSVQPHTAPQDRGMPVWWWIPGRSRARTPDPNFLDRLKDIDPRLDLGWNPEDGVWEVWYRSGNKQVPWTDGWKRLFQVSWSEKLDNRVFHVLYQRDNNAFGSAINWFNQVEAERQRDKEVADRQHDDDLEQMAREYWDYTKIKSTSHGGKFHRHHSGG